MLFRLNVILTVYNSVNNTVCLLSMMIKRKKKYLPLNVVFSIENLLQKCDESECANEYKAKGSIAEYVFSRRGVGVCHSSAQHPGLTVTPG